MLVSKRAGSRDNLFKYVTVVCSYVDGAESQCC